MPLDAHTTETIPAMRCVAHTGRKTPHGTWDIGAFENDGAADFVIDLLDSGGLSQVHKVLDNVPTSVEHGETPTATLSIVAHDGRMP